jgi:hypothetical protein
MKCTIYNSVRRLTDLVIGPASLWAFDHFSS